VTMVKAIAAARNCERTLLGPFCNSPTLLRSSQSSEFVFSYMNYRVFNVSFGDR
jgi:hypothetical protein